MRVISVCLGSSAALAPAKRPRLYPLQRERCNGVLPRAVVGPRPQDLTSLRPVREALRPCATLADLLTGCGLPSSLPCASSGNTLGVDVSKVSPKINFMGS